MAITVGDLVKKLQEKDQEQVVEFVVVGADGSLVCMDIGTHAVGLAKLLGLFNTPKSRRRPYGETE